MLVLLKVAGKDDSVPQIESVREPGPSTAGNAMAGWKTTKAAGIGDLLVAPRNLIVVSDR
jgi:hypothetical protein